MMDSEMPEFRNLIVAVVLVVLPTLLVGCFQAFRSDEDATPLYRGSDPFSGDSESAPPGGTSAADDDDQDGDGDDNPGTGGSAAEAFILELEPAPDSTSHHYRLPIAITFDGDGSGTTVRIVGPGASNAGEEVTLLPQQWSSDGTYVEILPAGFLAPESLYRVAIEQNGSLLEYSFTTSDIGLPLDAGVDVEALTYSIEARSGVVISPAGLAPLLEALPAELSWLWQFHSDSAAAGYELSIDTGLASSLASGMVQDSCTPTTQLLSSGVGLSLDDSYFSNAPGLMSFWLGDGLLQLEDALVDGDFAQDASSLEEVSVRGWLDSASLAGWVPSDPSAPGSTVGDPCDWLHDELGASCQTCPSGQWGCIWVHIGSLSGAVAAAPLEFVDVDVDATTPCDDDDDAFNSALSCSLGASRALPAAWLLLLPAAALLRRRP
jgi:hypothetical protein